ncbi:isocitrate lyase/phosphoenolpyruvate mutase family protein [Loigolactobacillus jiayinensis]|uniref:Isocitrate lyase/phosphoenolpyruvate mutase family protein n=1 Tax=Loigolactobacillus jiayinensis TaxID=2486016 RepID=A0ABW1R9D0_9LACO|nr:isocitrate lyase/phosphoenolpyruvate mutase family protein [Loigolactobacillus jiayinensis]
MTETELIPALANAPMIQATTQPRLFLAGSLVAQQLLGSQDAELLALSEYAQYLRYMSLVTDRDIWADAQSGFGNALNTYYTVQELARSGAAGIVLNDQRYPAHSQGQAQPVSPVEFFGKLRAAKDALRDESITLIAELDGWTTYGLSGLQERTTQAYKAGADLVLLGHCTELALDQLPASMWQAGLAIQHTATSQTVTQLLKNKFKAVLDLDYFQQLQPKNQLVGRQL